MRKMFPRFCGFSLFHESLFSQIIGNIRAVFIKLKSQKFKILFHKVSQKTFHEIISF